MILILLIQNEEKLSKNVLLTISPILIGADQTHFLKYTTDRCDFLIFTKQNIVYCRYV